MRAALCEYLVCGSRVGSGRLMRASRGAADGGVSLRAATPACGVVVAVVRVITELTFSQRMDRYRTTGSDVVPYC